jgi:cytochrome P450
MQVLLTLPEMRRKGLIRVFIDLWRKYGDVVRIPSGPIVQYLVIQPDDIRHVLLDNRQNYEKGLNMPRFRLALGDGLFTSEGELWKRQRTIMQPTFTPRAIAHFSDVMVAAINRMIASWEPRTAGGRPLNINTEMAHLAMDVIARTMFSIDIGKDALSAARAFTYVLEQVSRRSINPLDIPLSVPTPSNKRFLEAIATLDNFIYSIIDRRRQDPGEYDDLLTTLLNAKDPETGEGMSRRQLRDEVITIFFAGHETTAQALTWTWFLLSHHPGAEQRLHDEVDSVLGGRAPTVADLSRLTYTTNLVQESMRLYPPVWVFVRQPLADDELSGYHIPAGSMITFSPYITHRHPDFWDHASRFDPDRFLPERSESRPKLAYLPFGAGPRICIGNHFAMMEATLAVAMVAQRYTLRLLPALKIHPRMVGTLRPSGPVLMTLQPR